MQTGYKMLDSVAIICICITAALMVLIACVQIYFYCNVPTKANIVSHILSYSKEDNVVDNDYSLI